MEKQNNLEIESPDENKIKNKFVFVNTENIDYSFGEIVEELNLNSNDTIILMQSKNRIWAYRNRQKKRYGFPTSYEFSYKNDRRK